MTRGYFLSATAAALSMAVSATAQTTQQQYVIEQQPLADAIKAWADLSGREVVVASDILVGKQSRSIAGRYTPEAALTALLDGSGLRLYAVEGAFVIRAERGNDASAGAGAPRAADVVVTGSRIRGAPIASPVITLDRAAIRDSGISTLGDAVRTLPQSFGGGQNIGVGLNVPTENGANTGGGSSANLRGLGSDATLTLLNGHRMPYGAARQSVDISAIPLLAVSRLEIVPDGSSALYGSDAVAGVVNIILRSRFDGIETSAELGGSTDGGNFRQLYGAIAGRSWQSGGAFLAYEYNHTTSIQADDRDYTATRSRGLTLFPGVRRHNVAASVQQSLLPNVDLAVDAIFNSRNSGFRYALNAAGDYAISRGFQTTEAQSFSIAPRLDVDLMGEWRGHVIGSFGKDRVDYEAANIIGTTTVSSSKGCYCNTGYSVEVGGDGTLFQLAGSPVKLAIGGGFRGNRYVSFRGAGDLQNIRQKQSISFAYGEINVPLLTPERASPLGYRLNITGAVRYEHYAGAGGVATPKVGLIYAPTRSFDLKASWGRSFRAPTFLQQFQFQQGLALPVARLGGTGFAATATAIVLVGGNPDLAPERAQNLSATVAWHPTSIRNLDIELSYFRTRYVDRVVNPINLTAQSLSNPIFQPYVTLNPTAQQVQNAIAVADLFTNSTGTTFDPTRVAAIVNSLNVNAGRQTAAGVDVLANYRFTLGAGELSAQVNASYLESDRQLTPLSAVQRLAGSVFNPPNFRARGTIGWRSKRMTLTGTLSRIDGITDVRTTPATAVEGMTTLDTVLQFRPGDRGILTGLEITLSALNITNAKPASIFTTSVTDTPYDSTNYSPVGRYLSVGVSKRW
ncbi:TonB-dependent receptor [Roseomonas aeriglobus]|nr:TonB-dependent receptor [Roseomonas aeriglobus]